MSGAIGNLFVVFVFSVDGVQHVLLTVMHAIVFSVDSGRHVLVTVMHAIVTFRSEVFALFLILDLS